MPSLATFNANNFFLRYKFTNKYPGDLSGASVAEAAEVGLLGYLPGLAFGRYSSSYIVWDGERRRLTARALLQPEGQLPDILCLQEVENIQAIRVFNDRYLGGAYPYSLLIDGYDERNIDVGLLSLFPIRGVRSHIDDRDAQGQRVFSRDCLEAEIELRDGATLTLFINHLKSKLVRREANESEADYNPRVLRSHAKRRAQAQRVVDSVESRFAGQHHQALYVVLGDFNDTPLSPWLAPFRNAPNLVDVLGAHRLPNDRWTYYFRSKGQVSQIDHILGSRAFAARVANVVAADPSRSPHIERQGLAFRDLNNAGEVLPREARLVHAEADGVTPLPPGVPPDEKVNFRFPRFPEVEGDWKKNISDHCPVKVWF